MERNKIHRFKQRNQDMLNKENYVENFLDGNNNFYGSLRGDSDQEHTDFDTSQGKLSDEYFRINGSGFKEPNSPEKANLTHLGFKAVEAPQKSFLNSSVFQGKEKQSKHAPKGGNGEIDKHFPLITLSKNASNLSNYERNQMTMRHLPIAEDKDEFSFDLGSVNSDGLEQRQKIGGFDMISQDMSDERISEEDEGAGEAKTPQGGVSSFGGGTEYAVLDGTLTGPNGKFTGLFESFYDNKSSFDAFGGGNALAERSVKGLLDPGAGRDRLISNFDKKPKNANFEGFRGGKVGANQQGGSRHDASVAPTDFYSVMSDYPQNFSKIGKSSKTPKNAVFDLKKTNKASNGSKRSGGGTEMSQNSDFGDQSDTGSRRSLTQFESAQDQFGELSGQDFTSKRSKDDQKGRKLRSKIRQQRASFDQNQLISKHLGAQNFDIDQLSGKEESPGESKEVYASVYADSEITEFESVAGESNAQFSLFNDFEA